MASRVEIPTKLLHFLNRFPQEAQKAIRAAGGEFAARILETEGVKKYPPAGEGNMPPTPYYIRGRGTQYATYNAGNSERYGTRFQTAHKPYQTIIQNDASYAKYLADERDQARHMAAIGWRKLVDVAKEKLDLGVKIYQAWIERMIKRAGV